MAGLNIYLGICLLLAAFLFGALAVSTSLKVFRLRNKRVSWRAGTLKGFPLFSTAFVLVSIGLAIALWIYGSMWDIAASFCYLFISGGWFISSYFTSKRYIIDHGIVKNVNDPAQTVAWHQIRDYLERPLKNVVCYTFIYFDGAQKKSNQVVRLEIEVPAKKNTQFKKLIAHKLGSRIDVTGENITTESFE